MKTVVGKQHLADAVSAHSVESQLLSQCACVKLFGCFSIYCQSYSDGFPSVSQIAGMVSVYCESNQLSTLYAETVSKVLFANSSFYFIFIMWHICPPVTVCLCST